jgi:hypothetical protein
MEDVLTLSCDQDYFGLASEEVRPHPWQVRVSSKSRRYNVGQVRRSLEASAGEGLKIEFEVGVGNGADLLWGCDFEAGMYR